MTCWAHKVAVRLHESLLGPGIFLELCPCNALQCSFMSSFGTLTCEVIQLHHSKVFHLVLTCV